jgi:FAD/FMN-containing dehydrogenase
MVMEREAAGAAAIPERDARALEGRLLGPVVRPGGDAYEAARLVWNRAYDRRPELVVRAHDAADVIQAVNFARTHGLPIAVRSGGHSMAGHGTVDGGLVIDLAPMNGVSIDPARRVAWAEPGLTWGDYTAKAHAYGLATPAGDVATVGVGGLTLGGGIGWLARSHGLTIDSLLSVDLVTSDGHLVTASEQENRDLFWALRGGGGNFGIATSFRFKLHRVGTIMGGGIVHPATPETIRAYLDAATAAPDELTTIAFVIQAPPLPFIPAEAHGRLILFNTACYVGDPDAGARALDPLRALAGVAPVADLTGPLPYPGLFDFTAVGTQPRAHAVRSGFLRAFDDATVETVIDYGRRMTSPFGMIELRVLGGAMARVPADATAFAHRDKPYKIAIVNGYEDGQHDLHRAWVETFWAEIAPRTDGAYVNFLGDEGEGHLREAYVPETYARLARIKRRYDPDNVFALNPNITPA